MNSDRKKMDEFIWLSRLINGSYGNGGQQRTGWTAALGQRMDDNESQNFQQSGNDKDTGILARTLTNFDLEMEMDNENEPESATRQMRKNDSRKSADAKDRGESLPKPPKELFAKANDPKANRRILGNLESELNLDVRDRVRRPFPGTDEQPKARIAKLESEVVPEIDAGLVIPVQDTKEPEVTLPVPAPIAASVVRPVADTTAKVTLPVSGKKFGKFRRVVFTLPHRVHPNPEECESGDLFLTNSAAIPDAESNTRKQIWSSWEVPEFRQRSLGAQNVLELFNSGKWKNGTSNENEMGKNEENRDENWDNNEKTAGAGLDHN